MNSNIVIELGVRASTTVKALTRLAGICGKVIHFKRHFSSVPHLKTITI